MGSGPRAAPELLLAREGGQFPTSWSPTAPLLAFYELTNATARDILVWSKERGPERVRATASNETICGLFAEWPVARLRLGPIGTRRGVVHGYAAGRPDVMVSSDGGTEPVWSPDGRELFFRKGVELRAAAIDPDKGSAGPTTVLFSQPYQLSPPKSDARTTTCCPTAAVS